MLSLQEECLDDNSLNISRLLHLLIASLCEPKHEAMNWRQLIVQINHLLIFFCFSHFVNNAKGLNETKHF